MNGLLDSLTKKLNASGIHALRQLGRAVGVYSPTNKKKDELVSAILLIASNRADPVPASRRGAPPKSDSYDRSLLADVERCRRYFAGSPEPGDEPQPDYVASPELSVDEELYSGILENDGKFWFVRTGAGDVFVNTSFVAKFRLRKGDGVVCKGAIKNLNECPSATYIVSVNGLNPENMRRTDFESLTPCYPESRLTLGYEGCPLSCRIIDLFSPVGRGQRALVSGAPKTGKSTLLRDIAGAIQKNHPEVRLIYVLIDVRPEEVTDYRRAAPGATLFSSVFGEGDANHLRVADLAAEHAKRLVECGKSVVLIFDGITSVVRACSNLAGGGAIDGRTVSTPKRIFGAARNTEEGGSLTVIASVATEGASAFDGAVYEEFKAAANMEVALSSALAKNKIFPAIDFRASGALREEMLLSADELKVSGDLRADPGLTVQKLLLKISETADNAHFISEHLNG